MKENNFSYCWFSPRTLASEGVGEKWERPPAPWYNIWCTRTVLGFKQVLCTSPLYKFKTVLQIFFIHYGTGLTFISSQ